MKIEKYGKATLWQKFCRMFTKRKKGYGTMLITVKEDWNKEF